MVALEPQLVSRRNIFPFKVKGTQKPNINRREESFSCTVQFPLGLSWRCGPEHENQCLLPSDLTGVFLLQCSVSCGGGVRIRSVTCAKNNDEPCDMTRKPNSRALCGLRQCLSSRRVLKPNKGTVFNGKKLPTSEQDPLEPDPPTTSNPRMLTTATVPESMSTSSPAVTSPGPTSASKEGDLGRKRWQNGSTQTEPDSHDVISPGSTSQPILTSWSLSVQSNEENISKSDPGPTSDGDLSTTTTSSSDLSPSSNPVTWQVTPFYNTLTEEPEKEIHSGSGENSEQPEYKNENSSIVWTKIGVPGNDAPEERSTEMPLGPPPTPYLWGTSLWSPFSTVTKGLLPSQGPPALKNDMPRAEGMVTEKPAHTPLPLREDRQPAPSEKLVNRSLPELPNTSPTQSSEPVLTEEDATSLIAEGFLLNASNYKQLSTGRSTAHWVVGNWSEVGVPLLTPFPFLYGNLVQGVVFLCRFQNGLVWNIV